jgi:hypothetical protein
MLFVLMFCFLFNKIREQEGRIGSAQKQRAGSSNKVYTCKGERASSLPRKVILCTGSKAGIKA